MTSFVVVGCSTLFTLKVDVPRGVAVRRRKLAYHADRGKAEPNEGLGADMPMAPVMPCTYAIIIIVGFIALLLHNNHPDLAMWRRLFYQLLSPTKTAKLVS